MKPADLYRPCPRCGADCPAWVDHAARDRSGAPRIRLWCEAHGAKWVTA